MITFKSIIVLDTETTSLPQFDHNTTRITELAVLGCEIDHLLHSKELPRVLHKLVLLFNPMKGIHPDASHVSGIDNEMLLNTKPFTKQDAEVLVHFIGRLPPPVCMVAHNGSNFDFPILRKALESVEKNLPNNVYCADSMKAFKELLPVKLSSLQVQPTQVLERGETTPKNQETEPVNSLHYKNVARELFPDDNLLEKVVLEEMPNEEPLHQTPPQQHLDKTPPHESMVRELFQDDVLLERAFSEGSFCEEKETRTKVILYRPKSYKLKDVYRFHFGKGFSNAHRAEEDSKALLKCMKECKGFFDWIRKNAVVFNSIQPLF